ncbi:MAG TPA: DUF1844 domain-containing protein [Acidimicrobiales bacterium]
MSSLWTPGGERPVGRESSDEPSRSSSPPSSSPPLSPEEQAAALRELQEQLARTPAEIVVANHGFGLFELAALHLSQQPPNLEQAQLAIDALAALVDGLSGRLGEHETQLKDGLAELRMAFVQIKGAHGPQPEGPSQQP